VIKVHQDFVFVSLGGPHEGMVSLLQFESPPEPGSVLDVVVRRFSADDGLYLLVVPGQTIQADDWSDLQDGSIVDCTVTGVNSGGLEVKVGNLPGFMPAGQVAEHRVEDFQGYVDQRLTCIVTEASERRGRLIVSRRAVLERERQERRQAQLEQIQPGDTLEGTVRSIKDFGAFVDLGGLEGLLHISKLSWDKIEHPSEVLQEGQKVRVKIDKIEKHSGKISLSYRDLLENPWDSIEREHPIGSTVRGKVTRIANYGAFVKITTGIEGLIHVSELAHHRVFKVENVVKEGDEVEVKVLSIDREAQKVGLSLKATQAKPEPKSDSGQTKAEVEEPPRQPVIKRQHEGPLRGGTDRSGGAGEAFGLKW
jgi:small subunit ribosomal protein S1